MVNEGVPFVGIDLGGTHMQIGVVSASNDIIGRAADHTLADDGLDAVLDRMTRGVRLACDQAGVSLDELGGVGIGAPSPIDSTFRIALVAVNLGWRNLPLADLLSRKLGGAFVTLDNDVNVAVWGEHQLGAGRGMRNVLGIWIGTGIGGGLVLNGELFHGSFGTAGEIGHMVLNPELPREGNILEDFASRSSVVNTVRARLAKDSGRRPEWLGDRAADQLLISDLAKAVEAGDELVIETLRESARLVGYAAANAVTLLSLECVTVGGGLTEALGDQYLGWVRETFDAAVFPDACRACAIRPTELRENAGLLGAALIARERRLR
ncbi:MAG: ROK family protein [Phycisphaerales bacterium]